jgi:hypothetical protein
MKSERPAGRGGGSRFVSELEEKGISHVQMSGLIADVIVELIS